VNPAPVVGAFDPQNVSLQVKGHYAEFRREATSGGVHGCVAQNSKQKAFGQKLENYIHIALAGDQYLTFI